MITHTARLTIDRISTKQMLETGDAPLGKHIRLHRVSTAQFLRALHNGSHGGPSAHVQIGISTMLSVYAPGIKTWRELAAWLYPSWAPMDPENCVSIAIMKLRARGVPIRTEGSRKGSRGWYMDAVA